jgi:hypothetical protein
LQYKPFETGSKSVKVNQSDLVSPCEGGLGVGLRLRLRTPVTHLNLFWPPAFHCAYRCRW